MCERSDNNLYRIVLTFLNEGRKTFNFEELNKLSNDEVSPIDLYDALNRLREDKILTVTGKDQFGINVDISSFRSYVLKRTATDEEGGESRKVSVDDIFGSSWTAICPDESPIEDFIEKMKRERSGENVLWGDNFDDDDEDEDDDDSDDDEDDDEDDDDGEENGGDDEDDDFGLKMRVLKFCIREKAASVSLIQRHFPIGYLKSCKMLDWLEENHFISSQGGMKPRKVLINRKDFERIFCVPFDEGCAGKEEERRFDGRCLVSRASVFAKRKAMQDLVNVLSLAARKKSAPITEKAQPNRSLWEDKELETAVMDRVERLVKSDTRMGRQGAIKKAEAYLEAVRDTHDAKAVQLYERIVYELKSVSDNFYRKLKRYICG